MPKCLDCLHELKDCTCPIAAKATVGKIDSLTYQLRIAREALEKIRCQSDLVTRKFFSDVDMVKIAEETLAKIRGV